MWKAHEKGAHKKRSITKTVELLTASLHQAPKTNLYSNSHSVHWIPQNSMLPERAHLRFLPQQQGTQPALTAPFLDSLLIISSTDFHSRFSLCFIPLTEIKSEAWTYTIKFSFILHCSRQITEHNKESSIQYLPMKNIVLSRDQSQSTSHPTIPGFCKYATQLTHIAFTSQADFWTLVYTTISGLPS